MFSLKKLIIYLQINDLAVIGGSNVKENVRRVMSHVLHHALALQYNWAGRPMS